MSGWYGQGSIPGSMVCKGEPGFEELLRRIGLLPDLSAKSAVR